MRKLASFITLTLVFALSPHGAQAATAGSNSNEVVNTAQSATAIAQTLVGSGVSISNVQYTGANDAKGTFAFSDPGVLNMSSGVVMSSGNANQVIGPNTSDWNSTAWGTAGDPQLDALSGFPTYDASVLSFDFVPVTNQISFQYVFASDEYPEWVNTPFNDVFGFWITDGNGVANNCAQVRQTAGDPNSPFVPVGINYINNSNPVQYPMPSPMRSDLFRENYVGSSTINLEADGLTKVLTCQSSVTPGVVNHMRLAIADASDGIYDSFVFIKAGSLTSNARPVADLGFDRPTGVAPATISASVEGHDPNGAPLTYSINWGDGYASSSQSLAHNTTNVAHTYQYAGKYAATLSVSNGTYVGTSCDEIIIGGIVGPNGAVNESCDVSGTGVGQTSSPTPSASSSAAATPTASASASSTPSSTPSITSTAQPQSGSPGVDSHPSNVSVPAGSKFTMTATANGNPNPSVQWQVSKDGGEVYQDVPGQTAVKYIKGEAVSTLTLTANQTMNSEKFQAVFSNSKGFDVTDPGTLTVGNSPATLTSNVTSIPVGASTLFTYSIVGESTGTVTFTYGPTKIGAVAVVNGQATKSYAWPKLGAYAVVATFTKSGTTKNIQSDPIFIHVSPADTSVSVKLSKSKVVINQVITITATATVVAPGKTSVSGGLVNIYDGATLIASNLVLPSNGKANFSWTPTTLGYHNLMAVFAGGATTSGSSSSTMVVNVLAK